MAVVESISDRPRSRSRSDARSRSRSRSRPRSRSRSRGGSPARDRDRSPVRSSVNPSVNDRHSVTQRERDEETRGLSGVGVGTSSVGKLVDGPLRGGSPGRERDGRGELQIWTSYSCDHES